MMPECLIKPWFYARLGVWLAWVGLRSKVAAGRGAGNTVTAKRWKPSLKPLQNTPSLQGIGHADVA